MKIIIIIIVIVIILFLRELSGPRLVRCYGNLYSQARVEALEKLDMLPQLADATELKSKILFSVVVVSILQTKCCKIYVLSQLITSVLRN